MKSFTATALAALLAQQAAAHSTFQQLWVDGTDFGSQCARLPQSNSPITNYNSNDMRCNIIGTRPQVKCPVRAGGTVTVEMHAVSEATIVWTERESKPTDMYKSKTAIAAAPRRLLVAPTTAPFPSTSPRSLTPLPPMVPPAGSRSLTMAGARTPPAALVTMISGAPRISTLAAAR